MLDIVDPEADEKYYLSPAGCAGIVRRSIERNAGINERLKYHLINGCRSSHDLEVTRNGLKPVSEFSDTNIGLSVN